MIRSHAWSAKAWLLVNPAPDLSGALSVFRRPSAPWPAPG